MAEALGYVGGLIKIGAVAIAARYWPGTDVGGRLGVTLGAAGLLLAPGTAVPALYAVRTAS